MEQEKMKQILNYSIGYIRRKNPFVHSCILSRARYYIEDLIDENTLYSNTDSIVSLGRRVDLDKKLGHNIGDFKIKRKKVSVIGAGGAAKAIAYVLKQMGAKVCIFNRTVETAKNLAEKSC